MQRLSSPSLVIVPLLALALAAAQPPPPPQPPVLDHTGLAAVQVTQVLDGGRLIVDVGGQLATVRLFGIRASAPDDRAPSLAKNGADAKSMLTDLAAGEQVYLDPNRARNPANRGQRWPEQDEQGLFLAHVWRVRDGLLLNAELLQHGLVFYASNDNPREEYLRYYSWCQRQARDAHIGLWSSEQLVAAGLPNQPAPSSKPLKEGELPGIFLPDTDEPAPADTSHQVTGGTDSGAELPDGLTVDSASARVTKRSRRGWDYAWTVSLRNDNPKRLKLNLTVRFLDQDGYVLAEATQRGVTVAAHGVKDAKGTHKLETGPAGKVASISVLAVRAR